jgi:hypothetical protein
MADFDAQQPVRTTATEFTTEVANAAGTTINPAEDYAQGSTTSGQNGVLAQGAVTTAAPTYTTGQTDPLSLTVTGSLRVDGSGSTQPVSGTVAVSSVSGNVTVVQPTGSNLNVAVSNFPATQNINEVQIDGTAVSVNTGNADAGTQRVVLATNQPSIPVTFGITGTPTYDYATSTAVASGATATHSVAGPINIDQVLASASGEMKITIAWGTTGSEVTYINAFTSASDPTFTYEFPQAIALTGAQSIKITLKNRDTTAMDVYSTVAWH